VESMRTVQLDSGKDCKSGPGGLQVFLPIPDGLRMSPEDIVSKLLVDSGGLLVDSWWTPDGLQWSIPGLRLESI
jgi:hypothetical protein